MHESPPPILPPLAPLHQHGLATPPQHGIAQHGIDDLGVETSLPGAIYGGNPLYEGYLHGHESSIEGESSSGDEEDDSYEEDTIDKFLDWPPEHLLTP